MKTFEIYFRDLSLEAKLRLCRALNTLPEDENWEVQPLAIIEREEDENCET